MVLIEIMYEKRLIAKSHFHLFMYCFSLVMLTSINILSIEYR